MWGAIIGAVGGLLGGKAAGQAADTQAAASREATEEQRRQYNQTRADNAPFLRTGTKANTKLADLMGLTKVRTSDQIRADIISKYYRPGSTVEKNTSKGWFAENFLPDPLGFNLFGEKPAGGVITNPETIDEQSLQTAIDEEMAREKEAVGGSDYGSLIKKFSTADMEADPVYQSGLQFGLDEGRKGIERQGSATGSQLSGATLKALSRFGNDYASTKGNESFNRFNTENTGIYNKLAGLSGTGQVAVNQVSTAGQNAANQISQNAIGVGNARAASGIASSNALMGGINNAFGNYQSQQYLDLLKKKYQGGSTGGSSGFDSGSGTGVGQTYYDYG